MAEVDSGQSKTGGHDGLGPPFGYHLERGDDLPIVRRADGRKWPRSVPWAWTRSKSRLRWRMPTQVHGGHLK